jgi:transposase
MGKLYVVKLTVEERRQLERITRIGNSTAWQIERAHALLKCDQGEHGPGWADERVCEAYGMTTRSLENWRRKAVEQGPLSILERKRRSRPPRQERLDGEGEAQLTKLACSEAPDGRARWTLRLLADRLVKLEVVDSISHETVRCVLKKTKLSLGKKNNGASRLSKTPRSSAKWNK